MMTSRWLLSEAMSKTEREARHPVAKRVKIQTIEEIAEAGGLDIKSMFTRELWTWDSPVFDRVNEAVDGFGLPLSTIKQMEERLLSVLDTATAEQHLQNCHTLDLNGEELNLGMHQPASSSSAPLAAHLEFRGAQKGAARHLTGTQAKMSLKHCRTELKGSKHISPTNRPRISVPQRDRKIKKREQSHGRTRGSEPASAAKAVWNINRQRTSMSRDRGPTDTRDSPSRVTGAGQERYNRPTAH
ncbi:hypothetical protein TWF696_004576 [Orbilia brochopaga]|uniref:Uncharacterized protein n=1 Tax=Orbilia brochopaga TaxID=3140254 RepID=A0AAV9V9I1_9PEZI